LFATGGGSERARIDSSGRLLVGTSSVSGTAGAAPYARLQIEGNSFSGTGPGSIALRMGTAPTSIVAGNEIGQIAFAANNNGEFARIDCVADATAGTNDYPGRLVFSVTSDGSASPTEAVRINSNRQLLVGASSIGAAGAGVIYNTGRIASEGVYNTTTGSAANVTIGADYFMARSTSSGKYKTDIETLQDSYADAILGCRPVWFRSLCAIDNPDWGYWGFIAEEVAAIDPRLVQWKTIEVTYDEDGAVVQAPCEPEAEGVQYDRFVPHLLNLIKRQGEAIAELQAKVAALEAS
jgi:hypothetical protein